MDDGTLGLTTHFYSCALCGELTPERWLDFLTEIAPAIGMTPVYKPAVWTYPCGDKGGVGQTLVQPITESFIVLDTWPDHKGAYLFVCSCKRFDQHKLKVLLKRWNCRVGEEHAHSLRLSAEVLV